MTTIFNKSKLTLALSAALVTTLSLAGCQKEEANQQAAAPEPAPAVEVEAAPVANTPELGSGIDASGFDSSVRMQDDFFDAANGTWVAETEMPADRARWGTFDALREKSQEDVRALVEQVSSAENVQQGSATQKIRDYYNTYLDTEAATELGVEAMRQDLDRIASAESMEDIYSLFGSLSQIGIPGPIGGFIFSDFKDPNTNVVYIGEAGLTLPDRDYYLLDDERFVTGRQLYLDYATSLLGHAGNDDAAAAAEALLALETKIAEVSWTREQNRDFASQYNPHTPDEMAALSEGLDWNTYLESSGIPSRDMYVIQQMSYFEAIDDIINEAGVDAWKNYLTFQTLNTYGPILGDEVFADWFAFQRAGLQGIEEPRPTWKRGVNSINNNMGELLGQLYVEQHFQPEAKARMDEMIANLVKAYDASIRDLDWMSDDTKQQALDKLSKFNPKIGYPEDWRDYSKLEVVDGDLVGNVRRATEFEYFRNVDKLDKPVDKTEWGMNPQTVNAYYNPVWNEIVFPAAILQPPFFNVEADDAVNYGGIGAVIGHEIGHGFDDQGRKFDGDGNLRDWWTEEDNEKFLVLKDKLAAQYDGYEVIDGLTVNGQFTSGENIGDLGGLGIAYQAYKLSLNGEEAPVIDGLTGDQRFFLGWAQVWRAKARPEEAKRLLTIDPHSPPKFRTNGAAINVDAFYDAFDVKEGDGMFLPPEDRVKIW